MRTAAPPARAVFAGGDAVMGARTVVEAVAVAKKVAESMDAYMKSLPVDDAADPYADIPVFQTPDLRRAGQAGIRKLSCHLCRPVG